MGSATDHVLRESEVPVLVVRPDEVEADTAALPNSIMVLLDGSVQAERALTAPSLLGLPRTARIVLLRVVTTPVTAMAPAQFAMAPPVIDATALEEQRKAATDHLATARKWLGTRGYANVVADVQAGSSVAAAALDRAQELGIRLVALTTHGRGGISRLVMGSVADKVVRSGGPLILVFGRND
jgi:nucleotide-binding universal stress UspA family protein